MFDRITKVLYTFGSYDFYIHFNLKEEATLTMRSR